MIAVAIIERGRTQDALFSSSDRCTLESAPMRSPIAAFNPTRQATPEEGHPLVSKVVRTDELLLGAITLRSIVNTSTCRLMMC